MLYFFVKIKRGMIAPAKARVASRERRSFINASKRNPG